MLYLLRAALLVELFCWLLQVAIAALPTTCAVMEDAAARATFAAWIQEFKESSKSRRSMALLGTTFSAQVPTVSAVLLAADARMALSWPHQ